MTQQTNEERHLSELPLFPLSNTVLFPGMVLPLYIFEPRYRVMISRCIQLKHPFGVCLISEGHEVGGQATPYDIGTSAKITEVERKPDGTMNIQVLGIERFKVREIIKNEPYLTARTTRYTLVDDRDAVPAGLELEIERGLRKYIDTIVDSLEVEFQIDAADKGAIALAYLAAILLPLPPKDKQKLLEKTTLSNMLRAEKTLLKREQMLLDTMIDRQRNASQGNQSFSEN